VAAEFQVVRRYLSDVAAEVDRAMLDANGIDALVTRDDAGGMIPQLREYRLLVPWDQAVEALALLDVESSADD